MVDHSFGSDLADLSGRRFNSNPDGGSELRPNWQALGAIAFCFVSWLAIFEIGRSLI